MNDYENYHFHWRLVAGGSLARLYLQLILGVIGVFAVLLGLIFSFNTMSEIGKDTNRYISDLSYRIKHGEQEALIEMPVGIVIFSKSDEIEWVNPYLQNYFGDQIVLGKKIEDVDESLAKLINDHAEDGANSTVSWGDYKISLVVQRELGVAYIMDITHYENIAQLYNDEKLALGQIFLDNYDEITQSMTDQEISNLRNYVTNELSRWAQDFGMYIKQLDDDHFFLLTYSKTLKAIEEDKFKILDIIRESTSKQNFPLTLSIGIAYDDLNLNRLADQAQSNLIWHLVEVVTRWLLSLRMKKPALWRKDEPNGEADAGSCADDFASTARAHE